MDTLYASCHIQHTMATTSVTKTEVRDLACYSKTNTAWYKLVQNPPGGSNPWVLQYDYSSSSSSYLGLTRDRDDYKTWRRDSDFYQKVRLGLPLPEHDFTLVRRWRLPGTYLEDRRLAKVGSSYYSRTTRRPSQWYGDWGEHPSDLPWRTTHAQLQAKLLKKQRGDHWELPVFLAEGRKTAQMVVMRAQDLTNLLLLLKKGRPRDFLLGLRNTLSSSEMTRTLKAYNRDRQVNGIRRAGANLWLESWYGWVPFVSDVYDAFTTLQSLSDLEKAFEGRTRARVWSKYPSTGFDGTDWGGEAVRYFSPYEESRTAVWRWKPADLYVPAKLGLLNPLSVAWELLPFSFVADWFLPIGNWIDTLDAPLRAQHVGGSYGTKRDWTTTEILRNSGTAVDPVYTGYSKTRQLYVRRAPMTGQPTPGLDLLTRRSVFGKWHCATSIALLTQTMGWFKKPTKLLSPDILW